MQRQRLARESSRWRRGELHAIWGRVPPRVRAWIGRRVAADWRAYVAAFDPDARPDDERLAALLLDWQVAEMLRCFGVRFLADRTPPTPRPARVTEPGLFDGLKAGPDSGLATKRLRT